MMTSLATTASADVSTRFAARRHDDLTALEHHWRQLETTGTLSAFQRFDWLKAIDAHLVRPRGDHAFVIEVNDKVSGDGLMLLPLVLKKGRIHNRIEFLGSEVSDISAAILSPGYEMPGEAGALLWQAIATALPTADLVQIGQITQTVQGRPNPLASLPGLTLSPKKSFDVAMEGDPETVVDRLVNNQTRRILKTSARRMAERGVVRFLAATTQDDVNTLLRVMVEQRFARFRELGRFDHLTEPGVEECYRTAALASLDGRGPAQVFGLAVDDIWIATTYTLIHGNTIHLTIVTMAGGEWQPCSPGMAILARYMRWAREKGLTVMDFSVGDMAYKSGFGGQARDLYSLSVPLTGKGSAIHFSEGLVSGLKQQVKSNPALSAYARTALRQLRNMRR
ncbi:GNAT family N-acetyltransferase [Rhizobium wuzhouense]|uniref:GNAT family N-acetyltransferase n=1 Tax=Rhizobium wuzhouense TaxID=1986026 RepID=A0ABX5NK20_9HYPH|nr:GNAT family N-acetyltransferase [Rhizobium wuzhouense]PYB69798.1 GNAT family N-acetyltransferase [Rhizobium wuzhouense]